MSYYKNVYLRLINQNGNNAQERIQDSKEKHFRSVLKRSPNKVRFYFNGEERFGVFSSKTISDKEIINYLMVEKDVLFENGDMVSVGNLINDTIDDWLVLKLNEFTSIGYNRYELLALERGIKWLDEGKLYTSQIHLVGSGSASIISKFSTQFGASIAHIPNKVLNLVMKTDTSLKKGTRISIDNETYKVSGFDKISVPGVSYVTLEEDLYDEKFDKEIADLESLEKWTIKSNLGNPILFDYTAAEQINLDFSIYYDGELREKENWEIASVSNNEFKIAPGRRKLIPQNDSAAAVVNIRIKDRPEIEIFTFEIAPYKEEGNSGEYIGNIKGVNEIYLEDKEIYELSTAIPFESIDILVNDKAEYREIAEIDILDIGANFCKFTIMPKVMGDFDLNIVVNDGQDKVAPIKIKVLSPWLRG